MRCRKILPLALTIAACVICPSPVGAVITALTPLKAILEKEEFIFIARVKEVLPDKPGLVLHLDENLKGKAPFERLPINLTGNAEAAKGKHPQIILDRVEKELPIVVFATKRGPKYTAFGYTNGTWFQMEGRTEQQDGKNVVRWAFLSCEPYLRPTFKGTTAELKQTIIDGLSNKKEPPEPNEKEPPGYGEPIKKACLPGGTSLPLAVFQIPFIGLIAALAALFPTIFGGLALLMRRWLTLFSVISLTSIIYFLHIQFPKWIAWAGITSEATLWLGCAILTGLGALCSARRYRQAIANGKSADWQPRKIDRIGLSLLTAIGAAFFIYAMIAKEPLRLSPWPEILIALTGAVAGTFFVFNHDFRTRKLATKPALNISAETVMLWAAVLACIYFGALETGRASIQQSGITQGGDVSFGAGPMPTVAQKPVWVFESKENGEILSSPCLTPQHIVISVFHNEGLSRFGRVYALHPQDGKEVWRFPNDLDEKNEEEMLPGFCSPVYADGKIYVGEGFHEHQSCRMLCLDAATGKKLWEFKTNSHTESTPAIADGLIVFGAGNDGIYVLDANTGIERWHYTGERGLHMDANPAIAGGLIYAASGFSRTHQVNRIFCLDPRTKTEVWGERVELSAYGSPLVYDGKVFFTSGNSTYSDHREPLLGYVHCRDAKTGAALWDKALPDTVICQPAADRLHAYVSCWDGNCYALKLKTGELAWEKPLPLAGPGVSSPVVDRCPVCQMSEVLYVAGKTGSIQAVAPQTGSVFWRLDFRALTDLPKIDLVGTPTVAREEQGRVIRRRIYIPTGMARNANSLPVARLYCYEDVTEHAKP